MQNKIDKTFIISAILLFVIVVIPVLFLSISLFFIDRYFTKFTFFLFILFYKVILPIGIFIQIVVFILNAFFKNKTRKDWITIFFNVLSILFFSGLYILAILSTLNPLI